MPLAGPHGDDETDDVQERERDHGAPGKRVADAPVERVGLVLRESDDVGLRLDPGQPSASSRDPSAEQHHAQPGADARVESTLEEIERERTGCDEKHPPPDGPMGDAIAELVTVANLAPAGELDGDIESAVAGCQISLLLE